MALHTITLNASQEDALLALLDERQAAEPGIRTTTDELLLILVAQRLAMVEAQLAQRQEALMLAGQQLPQHIRERMTEGLTPEQLDRLEHIRPAAPRDREREAEAAQADGRDP